MKTTTSKRQRSKNADNIIVKGRFRIHITEDGKIVGDSGWKENVIVNGGFKNFFQLLLAGSAGSQRPDYAAIGTGTAPATDATTLNGELTDAAGCRCSVTVGTAGSKTVNYTFTLSSGVITAPRTINNVGLFNGSTTAAGTMMAGNTYTTSSLALNQAVNGTYAVSFA